MSQTLVALAEQRRDTTVQYLQDMTLLELTERDRPLGEVLMYLRTLSRDDALISRALSSLLDQGRVTQSVDHILALP